jgi:UDP-N-acetylglucosamine--N-acetylmuramyl-(pentapeptide) pyrophosphoryl-undecaprenol N-acetylglucosamine transferase
MRVLLRFGLGKAAAADAPDRLRFLMAGGGTGGHVMPLIAVARELRRRGHDVFFIGTRGGIESKLVPSAGFPIEYITAGGLKRVGWRKAAAALWNLPWSVLCALRFIRRYKPAAAFSMGGYVSGPAAIAAWLLGKPVVLMEPNAMPGMANRWMARLAARALLNFEESRPHFPERKIVMTGLPVRSEFFHIPARRPGAKLTILVTGGSRGSRRLNEACRQSWPLFLDASLPVRWIHQTGGQDFPEISAEFAKSGVDGEVTPFLDNMPQSFLAADLVVSRSGAGAVAELAAAGKPSILVPFPYAADDHQLRNAEAMVRAGAAVLIQDRDLTGPTLFGAVKELASDPDRLVRMGEAARKFARRDAAALAAGILEQEAGWPQAVDSPAQSRNN